MKYALFGNSGLRVSELCLGTMTFGTEWGWGSEYDESKLIFDAFANAGGNFLDTANRYTEGTSERWLGEFVSSDRDHFVIATKYTLKDRDGDVNFAGNHRKNLMRSLRDSLQRLNTDYIDVLWLHAWDFTTSEDEILRGLDDVISRGLVHYIGISDTPAWIVSRMNTIAELRGWNAFAGLQIEYSLIQRTPERDLLPMAKHLGLAVTPWGALGGGVLTGKYLRGETGRVIESSVRRNDRNSEIAQSVVDIAQQMDISPAAAALQWVRQKNNQTIIPIIGAKNSKQLLESLACNQVKLSEDSMTTLNNVSAIELGFPHDFLQSEGVQNILYSNMSDSLIRR